MHRTLDGANASLLRRWSLLTAVIAALAVMAPAASAATGTVTDPAGDVVCPAGFTVNCGSDLLGTTWTTHPDGTATIVIRRVATLCDAVQGPIPESVDATVFMTLPGRTTAFGAIGRDPGRPALWIEFNGLVITEFAIHSTHTIAGGVDTTTLEVPEAGRFGHRDFDYTVTNECGDTANLTTPNAPGAPSDALPDNAAFGPGPTNTKVRFPAVLLPPPGPVIASGAANDPAGDNHCPNTPNCGPDFRRTSWAAHPDGSVTFTISRVAAACQPGQVGYAPAIVLMGAASGGERVFATIRRLGGDGVGFDLGGGELWTLGDGVANPASFATYRATDAIAGGVDTTTLTLPASLVGGGAFDYYVSNECSPARFSSQFVTDTLPNAISLAGDRFVRVRYPTQALVTSAVAQALASAKPANAATLIRKGFPVTFTTPGAGTLTVTLSRTRTIRVHGGARAQARVLAKLPCR